MREFDQIRSFYIGLSENQRCDMAEAIADDILFLDEELQRDVIVFLNRIEPDLGEQIKKINDFTL